ncbi:unnamed protein product [Lactuca virosa]|uniref:Uncharacterized protein n=1 Tax=Lactuca virosa TaxID=75947 RepID=A0AAU9M364_9ASTR|nr:unnamed protein product [Lactuca virosa]
MGNVKDWMYLPSWLPEFEFESGVNELMKNYKPLEGGSDVVDLYMIVMNKENDGYCRIYGRGVTNKLIKEAGCGDAS